MLSHAKLEQARIIGQIQKCYTNSDALLTPTVNQIEFEKAIQKDNTSFFFEEVIKGYAGEQIAAIEKEQDETAKQEILKKSNEDLSSLQKIHVVFDNVVKGIYVDVIDTITKSYKDNEINRLLDRVGKSAVK